MADTKREGDAPRIFEGRYYESLAELEEKHWWFIWQRDLCARAIQKARGGKSGGSVLDIGCGTGLTLLSMAQSIRADQYFGLDVSKEALAIARRRGLENLVLGSAMELPFPDGRFDVVTLCDVLQHLPGSQARIKAVEEARRVMAAGAVLFVRTNARPLWKKEEKESERDEGFHRFSIGEIKEVADGFGFKTLILSHSNLMGGLMRSLREIKSQKGDSYGGLKISTNPEWKGTRETLSRLAARIENFLILKCSFPIPIGDSIILAAVKSCND